MPCQPNNHFALSHRIAAGEKHLLDQARNGSNIITCAECKKPMSDADIKKTFKPAVYKKYLEIKKQEGFIMIEDDIEQDWQMLEKE